LSGRPFFDFLTNAFEASLAFAAGWCAIGGGLSDPLLYRCAVPYFLLMCAGAIGSTLPDIPGDRLHGKVTTAVRFGPRGANAIALCALIAVIPVSIFLSPDIDILAFWCAALSIPLYILYMVRGDGVSMELTYKAGGALAMVAASLAAPLIFPAGIFIFFITWLYFKKRHNISYPSLTPDTAR
jgi:4-hydroxybenzoate polyprenyltransferase